MLSNASDSSVSYAPNHDIGINRRGWGVKLIPLTEREA